MSTEYCNLKQILKNKTQFTDRLILLQLLLINNIIIKRLDY